MKIKILSLFTFLFYSIFVLGQSDNCLKVNYSQGMIDETTELGYKQYADLEYEFTFSKGDARTLMVLGKDSPNFRYALSTSGEYYKFHMNDFSIEVFEFFTDVINVKTKNNGKWNITNESKVISNYICYKAIYSEVVFNENTKKNTTVNTTAWFTYDIPVQLGVFNYHGLPGLILQIRPWNAKNIFWVNKIVKNSDNGCEIKPIKGKLISYDEFEKMLEQVEKQ